MFTFFLQLLDSASAGAFHAFSLFFIYTWLFWAIRVVVARKYRPFESELDERHKTSVVIPVVNEPPVLFRHVLERIIEQGPGEIIVVINGQKNETLKTICEDLNARYIWTPEAGKRHAIEVGLKRTSKEYVVLVDSDTLWGPHTLLEITKPFRDPKIGGVTTRQKIIDPQRCLTTRWSAWLEEMRNRYSMPAMSVYGQVGCLPGRTIAFRRSVLDDALTEFRCEQFLGIHLEVSDDRSLTNHCLKQGYETVMQNTATVWTDAPTDLKTLSKQQFRWARGSQYNTLKMLPWMLKNAPFLLLLYVSDIVMPFFLAGVVLGWIGRIAVVGGSSSDFYSVLPVGGPGSVVLIVALILVGAVLSLALRQRWAVREYGHNIAAFLLINTLLLTPIRILGFFMMNVNAGWGTRVGSFGGDARFNAHSVVPLALGCALLGGFTYLAI